MKLKKAFFKAAFYPLSLQLDSLQNDIVSVTNTHNEWTGNKTCNCDALELMIPFIKNCTLSYMAVADEKQYWKIFQIFKQIELSIAI